jgi:hypothetical protein
MDPILDPVHGMMEDPEHLNLTPSNGIHRVLVKSR